MPDRSFTTGNKWETYTTTWAGAGSNPSIGNGTLTGRYTLLDDLLFVQIRVLMGSTTTYGTGTYSWTIPSGMALVYPVSGSASAFDSSAPAIYGGIPRYDSATTVAVLSVHAASAFWTNTVPATWAQSDDFGIQFWAPVTLT